MGVGEGATAATQAAEADVAAVLDAHMAVEQINTPQARQVSSGVSKGFVAVTIAVSILLSAAPGCQFLW